MGARKRCCLCPYEAAFRHSTSNRVQATPYLRCPCVQTTYDVVIRDAGVLRRFDWSAVVIDEGHSLKGEPCWPVQMHLPGLAR